MRTPATAYEKLSVATSATSRLARYTATPDRAHNPRYVSENRATRIPLTTGPSGAPCIAPYSVIIGNADDAPALLAPLEQAGHLSNLHFFAPTTRGPDGRQFRFHIEARVEPHLKIADEAAP